MHSTATTQYKKYTLTDLIPVEKLQQIQDAFALANQVASNLTDQDGVPITRPSNHCEVCRIIRTTEKGLERCILSGKELGLMAREQQHPVHKKCHGVGFTDAAAPIIIEGQHIANWVIGQYHTRSVDEQQIEEYALGIGADPEKLKEAFRTMPKLSGEQFENKLEFLGIMAHELSMMGYLHVLQKQQTAELLHIKAQLEEYQKQLENKVEQRTQALAQANSRLQEEIAQKSKIQKLQARLITAIQSADESIVITSPRGKIIFVNPAFEKLTGYSFKEAVDKTPGILRSGYHDKTFYTDLWQTITAGQTWRGRFVNRKKDGTTYQEDSTISPVIDKKGNILNFVAVKKDVTKECQLQAQLKQAQKFETIGTLAAGLAHEINTPVQYVLANTHFLRDVLKDLTAMQGLYRQLAESAGPAFSAQLEAINAKEEEIDLDFLLEEAETAIAQSLTGLERVADIVKAMKEFADPGAATLQSENLNELITSTVNVSSNIWDAFAEMELILDDSLPSVPLYAGRFKQMLLDMLINSAHALIEKNGLHPPHKGRITIITRLRERQVELSISDTGAGIPEKIISRIFDPFFTTKAVGQGEGQSLALAYKTIVEQYGGSIDVESNPPEGTTFTIRLPLKADAV